MDEIVIDAAPITQVPISLVGKKYKINPPKSAFAMKIAAEARDEKDVAAVMVMLDDWMQVAFGPTQHTAIQKRLADPKDALDIPQIMQLMEAVIARQVGNPTSS